MKNYKILIVAFLFSIFAHSQKFDKGIVTGPMTTAEINAISPIQEGRQIYNSTTKTIWYYNGTIWIDSGVGGGGGSDGNDFVTSLGLSGNILTATVPNQTNPTVDLSSLAPSVTGNESAFDLWDKDESNDFLLNGSRDLSGNIFLANDLSYSIGNITNSLASIYNRTYIYNPVTSDPVYTSNLGQTFYRSDTRKISYWDGLATQRLATEDWATANLGGGGGSIGGTIADNQIAFGSSTANSIEGSDLLTHDGTTTVFKSSGSGNMVEYRDASNNLKARFNSVGDFTGWARIYSDQVDIFTGVSVIGNRSIGFTPSTVSTANRDAAISRLGAASIAVGNGTAGDTSGTLTAASFIGDGSQLTGLSLSLSGVDNTDLTISGGNTVSLNESIQDVVGSMVIGNTETGITVNYDDVGGNLDFEVTATGNPLAIESDITGLTGAAAIANIVSGTEAEIAGWTVDSTRLDLCEDCAPAAEDTGTVLNMSDYFQYNMSSANSSSTYTLTDIRAGGYSEVRVNNNTEPNITGATKLPNTAAFIVSTDMIMSVKAFGSTVKYWFTEY